MRYSSWVIVLNFGSNFSISFLDWLIFLLTYAWCSCLGIRDIHQRTPGVYLELELSTSKGPLLLLWLLGIPQVFSWVLRYLDLIVWVMILKILFEFSLKTTPENWRRGSIPKFILWGHQLPWYQNAIKTENYKLISLTTIEVKIFNKILANNPTMYKKYHTHDQVGVIPVSQGGLTYTNQPVWYIILTKERQKTHDHLNKMSKKHLTKFNVYSW